MCVCVSGGGGGKLGVILVLVWESVFWAIQIPKIRPFIYFLLLIKGVCHIPGGAGKKELFSTHIHTLSYIG